MSWPPDLPILHKAARAYLGLYSLLQTNPPYRLSTWSSTRLYTFPYDQLVYKKRQSIVAITWIRVSTETGRIGCTPEVNDTNGCKSSP